MLLTLGVRGVQQIRWVSGTSWLPCVLRASLEDGMFQFQGNHYKSPTPQHYQKNNEYPSLLLCTVFPQSLLYFSFWVLIQGFTVYSRSAVLRAIFLLQYLQCQNFGKNNHTWLHFLFYCCFIKVQSGIIFANDLAQLPKDWTCVTTPRLTQMSPFTHWLTVYFMGETCVCVCMHYIYAYI